MKLQRSELGLSILLLPLALLSFWQIFENDLFYLLRAGHEMIRSRSFIETELWSFTAPGTPWLNHQWLSEVLFTLLEKTIGISSFPGFRVIMVFGILLVAARILRLGKLSFTESLCGCLFVFTVLYPRLQLRSELLVFILFGFQILRGQSQTTFRKALLTHCLFVVLWAQLHGGTAWIGGLYAFCHLQDRFRPTKNTLRVLELAPLAMMFVSPLGFDILKVLAEHSQLTGNPELLGIALQNLNPLREGLTYSAAFLAAVIFLRPRLRPVTWISVFLCLILILSLYRARILPYFALGLLPLWPHNRLSPKVSGFVVVMLLISIVSLNFNSPRHFGWGIDRDSNPVDLSQFLTKEGLQGRMLNHYNFGSYLLWAQPNLPVALDGRETPFLSFEKEMLQASKNPESWRQFLNRYRISFVVETRPEESKADLYHSHFPAAEWAAIYADELAVVLIRRDLTNQPLIDRLEIPF